jgi:histone deacetylase 1/2
MTCCKPIDTPISTFKVTIMPDPLFSNPIQFRQIVGALHYLTFTRPYICFAVNRVCQFMHAPIDSHWGAIKRTHSMLSTRYNHLWFTYHLWFLI